MNIGLITDSTCDLSSEIIDKFNIEIVPLNLHLNDKTYHDGIDIASEEFFEKLENVNSFNKFPTTSQPAMGIFIEKYKKMTHKYDSLISIHLANALSGTYEAASLASNQIEDTEIEVIDSKSTSLGLGFQVLLAAKIIENGNNVEKIKQTLKQAQKNLNVFFTVYDLDFLKKGGRISRTKAFLGSILNLNPILKLDNETGEIYPYDKVRGSSRTIKKIVKLA